MTSTDKTAMVPVLRIPGAPWLTIPVTAPVKP